MLFPQALSAVAAGLLLLPMAYAEPEFTNHGNLSGWTRSITEADGDITEVTDTTYRGDTALMMTQTYKEGYSGRYHSEVIYKNGYQRGDEKYYGFAFRLSEDWEFIGSQSYNIAQWIADFKDTGCDDWSPTTMIYLKGNNLYSRIKTGTLRKGQCEQKTREFSLKTGIVPGKWYHLTLHAKWESDETGLFEVLIDGNPVHEEHNIPTTLLDDNKTFDFRVGLYANGWHDKGFEGGQKKRTIWIDEVATGSELADVEIGKQ
jgi:hypothetical protein